MKKVRDWFYARRLRAVELYKQGWQQKLIAEALGVTKGAVSQWLKKVRDVPAEGQADALRVKKSTGRKPLLSADDRATLAGLVERGAESFGFVGDVWTAARVQTVARRELGVRAGVTTIKAFLHTERFSVQKPEVKATQQDETAVAAFREGWSGVKKKRAKAR